jgi:hypothetical protein
MKFSLSHFLQTHEIRDDEEERDPGGQAGMDHLIVL